MFGGGGGGGLHKNVSEMLSIVIFFDRHITGKTLSARKNVIGNITLSQISRLNLDKFGVGNSRADKSL